MPDRATSSRDELIARGKALAKSGKYARPRGEYLGRLDRCALNVYQGSPQEWIDALMADVSHVA